MSIRLWRSLGVTVLLACITTIAVYAKGGFSFITIGGGELAEVVRTSELALTQDFFAFADFYRDRVEAPADPGVGYEITRYYIEDTREIPFDRLHYYPATGFVYYDGIVNGSSEYDRKWYAANPEIRSVFESVWIAASTTQAQSGSPEKNASGQSGAGSGQPIGVLDRIEVIVSIAVSAAIAVSLLIFFSRRKVVSE